MNQVAKTFLVAIVAAVTCGAAFYYYPKAEEISVSTRETLLTEEEEFEPNDVRRVRIEQFDRVSNQPQQFEMERREDSWVVSGQSNYPARNSGRVASLLNSMSDKKILEEVSDSKDDHEEFSVLEVTEGGGRSTGVGTTVTFEGRNRKPLGKLIIGKAGKQKDQRYVRLGGQPQIYLVEISNAALSTDLAGWINPNLLQFPQELPLNEFQHIDIDFYFMGDEQVRSEGTRKYVYRARIRLDEGGQWVYDMWMPGDDQTIPEQPTVQAQPINLKDVLGPFFKQIHGFVVESVVRKQPDVASDFSEPSKDQPASHFLSLRNQGFRHAGFKNEQHQLDGAAGEITIVYKYGLRQKLYFGSAASVDVSAGGLVSRFMVSTADVDMTMLAMPKKPGETSPSEDDEKEDAEAEENADAEKPKQEEATANQEEAERQYQLDLENRAKLLDALSGRVSALNQFHADWIYVVNEDVVNRLFPPVEAWPEPAKEPAKE